MRPAYASWLAWWAGRWPGRVTGRVSHWAWERLLAAGAAGDPAARAEMIAIAEDYKAHLRLTAARVAVASWWAGDRDPGLRTVVFKYRLLAGAGPERWVTAALHNRLVEVWQPDAVAAMPDLLVDGDAAVRKGAEAVCAKANEPVLGQLWRVLDDASPGVDILTRNRHRLFPGTLEIAISRWVSAPDDRLLAAAVAPDTSEHLRPALMAVCEQRDLAPADPVERAAFYLVAGQHERYQASDPDGALLRAAYQGAAEDERGRLRAALIGFGELDLIRMLTGGSGASRTERDGVLRVLAGRGDWPELWRVTQNLSVVEAVAATRLFGQWRPADTHARALFDRLARTDPGRLATAIADASSPRLRLDVGEWASHVCAVSPDGSRLAVARRSGELFDLIEYALPSGRRLAHYSGCEHSRVEPNRFIWSPGALIHTGEAIVAEVQDFSQVLCAYGGGKHWEVLSGFTALAATRSGFVAAVRAPTGPELAFGTNDGRLTRQVAFAADLELDDDHTLQALATQPDTGLIALAGRRELIVLAPDAGHIVARAETPGGLREVVFAGPELIVTTDRDKTLTSWRLSGPTLTRRATMQLRDHEKLAALPRHNLIALRPHWGGWFYDAATLTPAPSPVQRPRGSRQLWTSLSGEHLVVLRDDKSTIEVHGPISALARRPLGESIPADLDAVEKAIAEHSSVDGELLELLHACLHHRFGSEIALRLPSDAGDEHDIALGDR